MCKSRGKPLRVRLRNTSPADTPWPSASKLEMRLATTTAQTTDCMTSPIETLEILVVDEYTNEFCRLLPSGTELTKIDVHNPHIAIIHNPDYLRHKEHLRRHRVLKYEWRFGGKTDVNDSQSGTKTSITNFK